MVVWLLVDSGIALVFHLIGHHDPERPPELE